MCKFFIFVAVFPFTIWAVDYMVTSSADSGPGTLRQAILDLNSGGGASNTITISIPGGATITLASNLPQIQKSVDISSSVAQIVDGVASYRLIAAMAPTTFTNINFVNGLALGGTGGASTTLAGGGGGGLGAGGAVYIDRGMSVSLGGCALSGNKAQGGNGGTPSSTPSSNPTSGGGGGASFSASSANGSLPAGGGDYPGLAPASGAATSSPYKTGYGGGAGGYSAAVGGGYGGAGGGSDNGTAPIGGYCGGGGGGGGGIDFSGGGSGGDGGSIGNSQAAKASGGGGGFGSGGGGGIATLANLTFAAGGGGGFGGGGGGGVSSAVNAGFQLGGGGGGGGFGGGGGAGAQGSFGASPGAGGSYGGTGGQNFSAQTGGGGGAGIGGAIFVGDHASLTLLDAVSISGSSAVGGEGRAGGASGSGLANDIFLFSNATLVFNGTGTLLADFAIQSDQNAASSFRDLGIIKQNSGTVTLSSINNNYHTTTINGGTLAVSSNANLGNSSGGVFVNGATLKVTSSFDSSRGHTITASSTFQVDEEVNFGVLGNIIGAGSLVKTGTGTLIPSGINSYAGSTTIASNGGTLKLGSLAGVPATTVMTLNTGGTLDLSGFNLGIRTLSGGGGTITNSSETSATFAITQFSDATYSGSFTGSNLTLAKTGTSTLTIAGGNSYGGGTTLTQGILAAQDAGAFGTAAIIFNGGTLGSVGTFTDSNNITLNNSIAGGVNVSLGNTYTLTGNITGGNASSSFTKSNTGTLVLTPATANTYLGSTIIAANGGILQFGNANALPSNTPMTLNTGGTLDLSGFNFGMGNLSGSGGTITNSSGTGSTLTVTQTSDATYSGNFTGANLALVKTGASTLTLAGASSYGGGTTLTQGILKIGVSGALGTGTFTFNGGTLATDSIVTSSNNISLTNSIAAIVDVSVSQNYSLTGNITGGNANSSFTKSNTGTLYLAPAVANTYSGSTIIATNGGTIALGSINALPPTTPMTLNTGGTLDLRGFNNGIGTLSGTGGTITSSPPNSATLTITQSSDATYAGNFTSALSLVKTGSSTLTLSGTNTQTGSTTIASNGGILKVGSANALSNSSLLILNTGGTLDINGINIFSGPLSGTGGTITNTSTTSATLTVRQFSNESYLGSFTGSNLALAKMEVRTLTIAGGNTYGGGTTILGGILAAQGSGAFGTGTITINGGSLGSVGTFTDSNNIILASTGLNSVDVSTGNTYTLTGTISGGSSGSSFAKSNEGTLILAPATANTYLGSTVVTENGGTLKVGNATAIPANSSITVHPGGTFDLNGFSFGIPTLFGTGGTFTNSSGTGSTLTINQASNRTYSGTFTGANLALVKMGVANLTLAGINSYGGGTMLTQGTLTPQNSGVFGTGTITFNGGTLAVLGTFADSNNINLTNSTAGTLSVSSGNTYTLTGNITGGDTGSSFVKTNTGTLILAPAVGNTYSGSTVIAVNGGTIKLGSTNAISTIASLTLNTGTTLDLNGFSNGIGSLFAFGTGGIITNSSGTSAILTINQSSDSSYFGRISGALSLIKTGSSTLTLFGITNTYTGSTTIASNGGTLKIGASNILPTTTQMILNTGGTLDLGGFSIQIGPLSGTGGTITSSAGTNAVLTITQNANATYAGNITGALGLIKAGSSTLTLSGTNTYTGATTIGLSAGTIKIASTGALPTTTRTTLNTGATIDINGFNTGIGALSGTGGTITNSSGTSATLTVTQATGPLTFAGNITGAMGFTKAGSATLILSGTANTYTGSTTIATNGGTLKLGRANTLPTTTPMILNTGGTLDVSGFNTGIGTLSGTGGIITNSLGTSVSLTINQSSDAAYLGNFTGSSLALVKTGTSTLTIAGGNNYGGGTTLTQGILAAQDAGAFGTATIIFNGGTLGSVGTFIDSNNISLIVGKAAVVSVSSGNAYTLAGNISGGNGANTFTKTGTGTLILTGNNISTFSGQIINEAGSTIVGNAFSFSPNVLNNGSLAFNQTVDGSYAGTVSTSSLGTMIKQGSNSLNYTGSLTQDMVIVSEGTLAVNTNFFTVQASTGLIIDAGALLQGTGTITGNTSNFGTLSPGNSIGNITFIGDYTQESGSVLDIELMLPNISDHVTVTGTFTIEPGAILSLHPDFGSYATTPIQIVEAGHVNGTFSSVVSSLPSFAGSVIYKPTEIQLLLSTVPINELVTTGNAGAVARCLASSSNPAFAPILDQTRFMMMDQITSSLEQMQPSLFTGFSLVQQQNILDLSDTLVSRFQNKNLCSSRKNFSYSLWAIPFMGIYNSLKQDSRNSEPGFNSKTGSGFIGADFYVWDSLFATGFAAAYSASHVHWLEAAGKGSISSWYGAWYISGLSGPLFYNGSVTGAFNQYCGHRNIDLVSQHSSSFFTADHRNSGYEIDAHVDFGAVLINRIKLFLGVDYVALVQGSYEEHGAGVLDLNVQSSFADTVQAKIGFSAFACLFTTRSLRCIPEAGVFYVGQWRINGTHLNASFSGSSCNMYVAGLYPNRNLLSPMIKVSIQSTKNPAASLSFSYQGEFGDYYKESRIALELSVAGF